MLDNTDNHNNTEEKNLRGIVHEEDAHFDAANQHHGVTIMKPPANRGISGGKVRFKYSDFHCPHPDY